MGLCNVNIASAILVLENRLYGRGRGRWRWRWAEHTGRHAIKGLDTNEDFRVQHLIIFIFEECFQAHEAEQWTPSDVSKRSVANGPVEAWLVRMAESTISFSFWKEVGNQCCCLTAIG